MSESINLVSEVSKAREKAEEWKDLLYQAFCDDTYKFSKGRLSNKLVEKAFYKTLVPVINEAVANKLKGSPRVPAVKMCNLSLRTYATLVALYDDLFKFRVLSAEFDEDNMFCEVILSYEMLSNTEVSGEFVDTLKGYTRSLEDISTEVLKALNKAYDYIHPLDYWVRGNIVPDFMFYLLCDRRYFRHTLPDNGGDFEALKSLLSNLELIRVLQMPDNAVMVKIGVESK